MDIANSDDKNEKKQLAKTSGLDFQNEEDEDSTLDESLEKNPKNPMLLSPVIRCVLKFMNIEDIKNCRLVCHEWGSTGKLLLTRRARIHIHPDLRRPSDFHSCFLNSANLFSAIQISGYLTKKSENNDWTIEELAKFFEDQQKFIKELTLKLKSFASGEDWNLHLNGEVVEVRNTDISSWISKSPMVQKGAKHMTKLSIEGAIRNWFILPLHLIAEIKDLTLSRCRINLDPQIKICSTKLKLKDVVFFQDGIKTDQVRINDIVDIGKAEEVSLHCGNATICIVDLFGNAFLRKLDLEECEILNGETSQWVIEHLSMDCIPYSLHSEMKIKELYLSQWDTIELSPFLPNSIEKLALDVYNDHVAIVSCSQPIVLQNLQYLRFGGGAENTDLSHFMNCPRLTHLKFDGCKLSEQKFSCLPKNLKTLTIENSTIHWVDDICFNLERLIIFDSCLLSYLHFKANEFPKTEIRGEELVFHIKKMALDKHLVHFLEYRNLFHYGGPLYIGRLYWGEEQLEGSVLKEYVDVKSSFYVFENGEKGRAISEKAFYELIPKHFDFEP